MLRKLLVNALALIAVLALAGGAMAAAGSNDDGAARSDRQARESRDGAEDVGKTLAAEAKAKAKAARNDQESDDDTDEADDRSEQSITDDDSFGAARSAEVAEYHACRDAAVGGDDDCTKPGPAWQNDAHPVFGTDGDKAGETPGASAAAGEAEDRREDAAAQRPERAADSDDSDDDSDDDEDEDEDDAGRGKAAAAGAHGKGQAKAGR